MSQGVEVKALFLFDFFHFFLGLQVTRPPGVGRRSGRNTLVRALYCESRRVILSSFLPYDTFFFPYDTFFFLRFSHRVAIVSAPAREAGPDILPGDTDRSMHGHHLHHDIL